MDGTRFNTRRSLIIFSTILLILVLGFTGVLNIMSFQENYSASLVSSYAVLGQEAVGKIEYALKYGKPLDSFWGMEKLLQQISSIAPEIDNVQVLTLSGQVIYDQKGRVRDSSISQKVLEQLAFSPAEKYQFFISDNQYCLLLPISGRDGQKEGFLQINFPATVVEKVVNEQIIMLLKAMLLLVAVGFLALAFLSMGFSLIGVDGKLQYRKIVGLVLTILAFLQLSFGFLNYHIFRQAYLEVAQHNTALIGRIIQSNVNGVLDKGVPYNELYNIEAYFQQIISSVPEIENISLHREKLATLYAAKPMAAVAPALSTEYVHAKPLHKDMQGDEGLVRIEISPRNIAAKLRNILLDTATILVVSFILMVELTLFAGLLLERRMSQVAPAGGETGQIIPNLRALAFLIFAAAYMSASFIPVLMSRLYEPLGSLPKSIVLGLPISAEMLAGGLAAVAAGHSIDQKGCKPVLLKGIILFAGGTLFSAAAWNSLSFITARALAGGGFGLVLTALRTLVVSAPDPMQKNQGVAALNSGAYAGVNCGIVVGAMLADRIGFSPVFIAALGVVILAGIMTQALPDKETALAAPALASIKTASIKEFVTDRLTLNFLLLVLLPVSAAGMFLSYLFPIYADSLGVSSSSIGRAFLLNGLLIIYSGPILSKLTEKYWGSRKALTAAVAVLASALLLFAGWGTLAAAYVAVLLLGLADSFGAAAQSNYYLSLPAVSRLGEGKSIAYFSIIGKLGQMLGPLVFGALAALGMDRGTGIIGLAVLAALVLFAYFSRSKAACRDTQESGKLG